MVLMAIPIDDCDPGSELYAALPQIIAITKAPFPLIALS